jgi:hypothetical protein
MLPTAPTSRGANNAANDADETQNGQVGDGFASAVMTR